MTTSRNVYRRADLTRLFAPASIAIVGASPTPTSLAARQLANLGRYRGRVDLVNARHEGIGDRRCYPTIASLPEIPDLAIVCVNRDFVIPVAEECAAAGVGGIVVYASGFTETGREEHRALQERLSAIARGSKLRILGPNVVGFVNYTVEAFCTFTGDLPPNPPSPHSVALVGQSGAVAMSALQGIRHGAAISHAIACGNSCDVDVADGLAYLAEEPACGAIVCMVEGIGSSDRLIEATDLAADAQKPVVVFKMATGETGVRAALSHTGSLAGSSAAFEALTRRCGMVGVRNHEALVETATFLAKAPPPRAAVVALITNSGGVGVMMADWADAHGVPLPQPSEATRVAIAPHVPEFGSVGNPCDVTAAVTSDIAAFAACSRALLADETFGALVVPNVYCAPGIEQRQRAIGAIGREIGKPVLILWCAQWWEGDGAFAAEQDPNLSIFRSADHMFRAIGEWRRWHAFLAGRKRRTSRHRVSPESREAAKRRILASPNCVLSEREAKQALAEYGVPVAAERLACDEDGAVAAAGRLGWPVALKLESPDVAHKTEAGVVRLDLCAEAAVREAYREILAAAERLSPRPRVTGALVQAMAPTGLEIFVGSRIDPQIGPLVVVGLGGVFVELLRDTATAIAPVDREEAAAMLSRLRGVRLLGGFRGQPAVDREALADVVVRVSELADDLREIVVEIDVNPLVCFAGGIVAVDALIVRRPTAGGHPIR